MGELLMPSLGADMEAGTLIEWEKKPGEAVKRGDVIAVVETQKGAIEIEVYEDGILDSYLVDIGKPVPVGTPLAKIVGAGKTEPEAESPKDATKTNNVESVQDDTRETDSSSDTETIPDTIKHVEEPKRSTLPQSDRQRITPAARNRAAESGINTATLQGTGPNGEIVLADVINAGQAPAVEHPEQTLKPTPRVQPTERVDAVEGQTAKSGMRDAIAAAMSRSKREIPHYYLSHTVDLSTAQSFVAERNENREPSERLLLGALYVKSVALALQKFPEFNGHYTDGKFQPSDSVHAGMAINIRGGGLVAPAIHDAQSLDLDTMMKNMRDLVTRVRSGRFRAAELADPTITISSLGERGVDTLYGVIYPPQVAILGLGTPVIRPMSMDGDVVCRLSLEITLAGDHRVSDGHRGALFLRAVQKMLQEPEAL